MSRTFSTCPSGLLLPTPKPQAPPVVGDHCGGCGQALYYVRGALIEGHHATNLKRYCDVCWEKPPFNGRAEELT